MTTHHPALSGERSEVELGVLLVTKVECWGTEAGFGGTLTGPQQGEGEVRQEKHATPYLTVRFSP